MCTTVCEFTTSNDGTPSYVAFPHPICPLPRRYPALFSPSDPRSHGNRTGGILRSYPLVVRVGDSLAHIALFCVYMY